MEMIHLTKALLNKIDAFQVRGLRKFLNLRATFIDKRFTKRNVLDRVSVLMFRHHHDSLSIFSVIDIMKEGQNYLVILQKPHSKIH